MAQKISIAKQQILKTYYLRLDEHACADLDLDYLDPDSPVVPKQVPYKAADSMAKLKKKVALKNYVSGENRVSFLLQS